MQYLPGCYEQGNSKHYRVERQPPSKHVRIDLQGLCREVQMYNKDLLDQQAHVAGLNGILFDVVTEAVE